MAVSSVGILGEGMTQGRSVASQYMPRDHPSMGTTSSAAPRPWGSLKRRAISPTVMPCRIGIGYCPTKDSYPVSSIGPSMAMPPIGLGRSQTITGSPFRAAAARQFATV